MYDIIKARILDLKSYTISDELKYLTVAKIVSELLIPANTDGYITSSEKVELHTLLLDTLGIEVD